MSDNSFFQKIKGKYEQIRGRIKEKRADAKIREELKDKEEKINEYLEDLKSGDSKRISSATERVEQVLREFEDSVDRALKR